ncbi:expressed unknown protein [Seminavis robusta]|uniref:Protein YAE1 n=1 Tax=Seminavis robusta TaxID=568900 RepID=A0A9N8F254_9STRA|nr:expressed unknown protein [Seminavis robusta]|eukprot:Sro2435_g327560.1 n/a (217) ;mRNA; r:7548-8198
MSSTDNNNSNTKDSDQADAWDDLCVNPQQVALETGRQEGRQAGLVSGFNDGKTVGIVKGVEYGMEVGFVKGVVKELSDALLALDNNNADNSNNRFGDAAKVERIQNTLQSLTTLLDAFPSPQESFQGTGIVGQLNSASDDNDDEEALLSGKDGKSSTDLEGHMQRIRAKFKLLMVQLRWNNFSLKAVMDAATAVGGKDDNPTENQTATMIPPTSDW